MDICNKLKYAAAVFPMFGIVMADSGAVSRMWDIGMSASEGSSRCVSEKV